MKITLMLCLVVALAGCSTQTTTPSPTQASTAGKVGVLYPMEAPIIVSDGSPTHLKHLGLVGDFILTNKNGYDQVIVNDAGYSIKKLACEGAAVCPNASAANPNGAAIDMAAGWSLDVLDGSSTPVRIMTVSSTDNLTITTNFYTNFIDPKPDTEDTGGTDIIQHDYQFKSAKFTNGAGASVPSASIACTAGSSSKCRIRINYHYH